MTSFVGGVQHEIGCNGAEGDGDHIEKVEGSLPEVVFGVLKERDALKPSGEYLQWEAIESLEELEDKVDEEPEKTDNKGPPLSPGEEPCGEHDKGKCVEEIGKAVSDHAEYIGQDPIEAYLDPAEVEEIGCFRRPVDEIYHGTGQ